MFGHFTNSSANSPRRKNFHPRDMVILILNKINIASEFHKSRILFLKHRKTGCISIPRAKYFGIFKLLSIIREKKTIDLPTSFKVKLKISETSLDHAQ